MRFHGCRANLSKCEPLHKDAEPILVNAKLFWVGLIAALMVATPAFVSRMAVTPAVAAPAVPDQQPGTTLDDQVDLAVTVYNSNIALVRDVRQIRLPDGVFDLRFMDIT